MPHRHRATRALALWLSLILIVPPSGFGLPARAPVIAPRAGDNAILIRNVAFTPTTCGSYGISGYQVGAGLVYVAHNQTDFHLCYRLPLGGLTVRAGAFKLYLTRYPFADGASPNADTMQFVIDKVAGASAALGGGAAPDYYSGPEPGDWSGEIVDSGGGEFRFVEVQYRISRATIAGLWNGVTPLPGRIVNLGLYSFTTIGETVASEAWPTGLSESAPATWIEATFSGAVPNTATDFVITGIEAVQAIQDLNNSVPLIANKRTFIRVHVKKTGGPGATGPVTARLTFLRNGQTDGPRPPDNPGAAIMISTAPDRGQLNDSFYFEVPAKLLGPGTLDFSVEINPSRDVPETDYSNNTCVVGSIMVGCPDGVKRLTFQDVPEMRLHFYDWVYQVAPPGSTTPMTMVLQLGDSDVYQWLKAAYPFNDVLYSTTTVWDRNPYQGAPDAGFVLDWLAEQRADPAVSQDAIFVALVGDSNQYFMRGRSPVGGGKWYSASPAPGLQEWQNGVDLGDYAGHEIGHSFGHVHYNECVSADAQDGVSTPYPNGIIGGPPGDTTKFYGMDARAYPPAVVPNTIQDNMCYGSGLWWNDIHYKQLISMMNSAPGAALRYQARFTRPGQSPAIEITGDLVTAFGSINLDDLTVPSWRLTRRKSANREEPRRAGDFRLRLYGAGDNVLAEYPFTPDTSGRQGGANLGRFALVENFVAGARRIAIYADAAGKDIAAVDVGSPPSVQIVSRSGGASLGATGEITLDWQGSDPDGDTLRYQVRYSNDNKQTWRTIAQTRDSVLKIDLARLPGAGGKSQGWFRVEANDGFLVDSADNGPFGVAAKPPRATITHPKTDARFTYGQVVHLVGHGQDLDDGTLSGKALRWSSNLDGDLGDGEHLTVATLRPGAHTITLRAANSAGPSANSTIRLTVGSGVAPPPGPILRVTPATLAFEDRLGGANPSPKALSVANIGVGQLYWTATSNAPWLKPAGDPNTADEAPGKVDVAVDSTGLMAGGLYQGAVTIAGRSTLGGAVVVSTTIPVKFHIAPQRSVNDSNNDGRVTIRDIQTVAGHIGRPGPRPVASQFGQGPPVPEDAALIGRRWRQR